MFGFGTGKQRTKLHTITMVANTIFIEAMATSIVDMKEKISRPEPPPIDQKVVDWILKFYHMEYYAEHIAIHHLDPRINPRLYSHMLYGFAAGVNSLLVYNDKWDRTWRWGNEKGFENLKKGLISNLRRPDTVFEDILRCGKELIQEHPYETMTVEDNITKFEKVLRDLFVEVGY